MTTLSKDAVRAYEPEKHLNSIGAVASDIIYEGAAVGDNASGYGRPLVAGDTFRGMCKKRCDNSAGSAGDKNIELIDEGVVILNVVGVTALTDRGATVYASDDDTFTLSSTNNSSIGKIIRRISGTKCAVHFQAAERRSI